MPPKKKKSVSTPRSTTKQQEPFEEKAAEPTLSTAKAAPAQDTENNSVHEEDPQEEDSLRSMSSSLSDVKMPTKLCPCWNHTIRVLLKYSEDSNNSKDVINWLKFQGLFDRMEDIIFWETSDFTLDSHKAIKNAY